MASAVSMHLRETKGDGIEDNTHTQGCQNRPIEPNGYRAIKVLKLKTKKEKEDVFIFIVLSFFQVFFLCFLSISQEVLNIATIFQRLD